MVDFRGVTNLLCVLVAPHARLLLLYAEGMSCGGQVPSPADLPRYKEFLDPLLPGSGAASIHTSEFRDGRRIPTLAELLEKVAPNPGHVKRLYSSKGQWQAITRVTAVGGTQRRMNHA